MEQPLRRQISAQRQNPGSGKTGCNGIYGIRRRAFPGLHVKHGFFNALAQSDGAVIKTRGQDVGRGLAEGEKGVCRKGCGLQYLIVPLIPPHLGQCLGKRCGVAVSGFLRFLDGVGPCRLHVCGSGPCVGLCRRHALGLQCLGEAVHIGVPIESHILTV